MADPNLGFTIPACMCHPSYEGIDMDNRKGGGWRERMEEVRGKPLQERKPMGRGEQTAWIVAAIAVAAFLGVNYLETRRDPCASFFVNEIKCRADLAVERLNRY